MRQSLLAPLTTLTAVPGTGEIIAYVALLFLMLLCLVAEVFLAAYARKHDSEQLQYSIIGYVTILVQLAILMLMVIQFENGIAIPITLTIISILLIFVELLILKQIYHKLP